MLTVFQRRPGFRMDRVGVAILAGGQGTRMGGRKPERHFRGRRLIDPVLDRVSAWGVPAVICVREYGQVTANTFGQILDQPEIEGPLAGLLSALAWASSTHLDHLLTLPCDAPFLPEDLLSELKHASLDAAKPAVAASNGQRHPTCAIWPVDTLLCVTTYAGSGRRSLSGALDACEAIDVCWPEGQVDVFANINPPEDIIRLEL